ncbi:hypothetical protein AB4059_00480 [Lysobacter sp. 2RAF19]
MGETIPTVNSTLHDLHAITFEQLRLSAAVRVTDGTVSTLLWVNPDRSRTKDLFIRVPDITAEHVDPVRRQVLLLLAT